MVKHTLPRRLTALLLAGLVCAASSGLAIHDPDCAHHEHGAASGGSPLAGPDARPTAHDHGHATHEDAGAAAPHHAPAGEEAVHAASQDPAGPTPAGQDCQCLGFCAVAGQAHATVTAGAVQLRLAARTPVAVVRVSTVHRVPTRVSALQPPATGPPALS